MKIGILATGITPDELLNEYGSYADMFVQLFDQAQRKFEYEVFDVREGEFPGGAEQCDGWIITGSKFNVYQNLPWMQQLKQLILEIHAANKPMIGICFGHQIIAEAFGGKVDKYPGGWGVGLHSYELRGATQFIKAAPTSFTISAMHQDQVLNKPDNAQVFACSDFCQYAGLIYDDRIITFQAHPEFNVSYEEALVDLRKGAVIPTDTAEQGLTTLRSDNAATDSVAVAHWMADFLEARA
ncbi:glutamine amidotransferase-related protein [Neptuniibacter halophilus]|uniref:glutamine amidotransferase-related protein n=1 Tax=Neptuniibacter halophilus TaxID=651666 RepID=UPI0025722082|nr:gamma-glutamyl-gamma-aminobutyrate hydrolase family protein [Neptuniibacter halophilus]